MTKKKNVEDACHDDNRRKISQTYNTPLKNSQISQDIGFDGTYDSCLKILQEHYNTPLNKYDYTTVYLKHLRRYPNIINNPQAIVSKIIFQ